jgi:hypothetical protein
MTSQSTAHIFLDANTALHFKRPDQIDWCALTGQKKVVLVGAPVLMNELEKQKVHNPSCKLRERADAYIKWLVFFVRDSSQEVRPGVHWHFIPHEPHIDFVENNLSTTIADDHLIASVLNYQVDPPDLIYVATADIGLEVKLRAREIDLLLIPESAKRPSEPDPQEKELQTLRLETARHKSRLPLLTLKFKEGKGHLKVLIKPPLLVKSLPNIRSKYLPSPIPPEDKSPAKIKASGLNISLPQISSRATILKYNEKLEEFFTAYEKYQSELIVWKEKYALLVEVELIFSNEGTVPASNIDVILDFPNDIELFGGKLKGFPERPKAPKPPREPGGSSLEEMLGYRDRVTPFDHSLFSPFTNELDKELPHVNKDENRVTFDLNNLKHGFQNKLKMFYFRFPSREDVRSFNVTYHLSAAELPMAAEGELHVVVTSI